MSTFKLPDLGEGLAEAEILQWHVQPGDHALVDRPLVSVETAKAVVEIPVPFNAIVEALHAAVGDIVATGAPLVDFDSGTVVGSMPATSEEAPVDVGHLHGVRRSAAMPADPSAPGAGSGPASGSAPASGATRALPVARAVARHLSLDLAHVSGSGPAGVIRLHDVLAQSPAPRPSFPPLPPGCEPVPLRGLRRAMAQSMSRSHAEVALSTVCDDADLHAWTRRGDYMLRLVRALIAAWRVEPALNAWYDAARTARILHGHVDLAFAVDTGDGLLVPVLRGIEHKTVDELRAALAAHKAAAHGRSVVRDDLRNFTLMLSNFGTLAGRYGIPLVVPPAVAILGAGAVRMEAVVDGTAVVTRPRMPLSLSFDHRCVTGGEACRFLAAVIADLQRAE